MSAPEKLVVDGRVVAEFYPFDGFERPAVEDVVPLVPIEQLVPLALAAWAGRYLVSADEALLDALVAEGATVARHAHVYGYDLRADTAQVDPAWAEPVLRPGLSAAPVDCPAEELAEVVLAAYPPGHPDHEFDTVAEAAVLTQQLIDGELVGDLMPSVSGLVRDGDRVVAFVLVNRMPGDTASAGPWVSDVARLPEPRYRGLGSVLIRRTLALLAAAGEATLGLAVTEGNPARSVYEGLGFRPVSSARRLLVPDTAG